MNNIIQAQAGTSSQNLVSQDDLSRALGGLSGRYIYTLRQRGMPHKRIGRRVLYDLAAVRVWLDRQEAANAH